MRGLKYIVGVLISAVALSQLSLFVPIKFAMAGGPLGTPLPSGPDQAMTTLGPTLSSKIDGRGKNAYDYYQANFASGANASATLPPYVGNSDPAKAFKAVYDDAYNEAKSVNGAYWGSFNNQLATFYHGQTAAITGGTFDPATFNSLAKSILDIGTNNIMPAFLGLYAGMKDVSGMLANSSWGSTITSTISAADNTPGLVTQMANDLDTTNRTEGGTYGAQSSRIVKPLNLEGDFTSGNVTDGTGSIVYLSSSAFYTDFSALYNDIASANEVTSATDAQTILANLLSTAKANDATQNGTLEAGNGPCGKDAGLNIVVAVQQGVCSVALLGAAINGGIVNSAAYILAVMVPLGGASTIPGAGTGSFFTTFIPKEIRPVNIIDTLNQPIIADMVNVVIRLLGTLVIIALITIAFANILQIQVNTYGIKKAIPALVLGFLLAYGGVFATKVLIEFSNNIATFILSPSLNGGTAPTIGDLVTQMNCFNGSGNTGGGGTGATPTPTTSCASAAPDLTDGKGGVDMGKVLQQLLIDVLGFLVGVMMFILGLLFVVRGIIFIALVPLAPLAYFGITFDMFKPIWERWWKTAQGWLFMNAVAAFWLWLMFQMFKLGKTNPGFGGIISYVFGTVCMYFAMTTPFKMAGEAKAVFGKLEKSINTAKDKVVAAPGQGALYAAKKYTPIGAGIRGYKQFKSARDKQLKQLDEGPAVQNRLARKLGGDKLNKSLYKYEQKVEQQSNDLKSLEEFLQKTAEEERMNSQGFLKDLRTSLDKHNEKFGNYVDKLSNSNSKFAKKLGTVLKNADQQVQAAGKAISDPIKNAVAAVAAVQVRGKTLGQRVNRVRDAANSVGNWAVAQDLIGPSTPLAQEAYIREKRAFAKQAQNRANNTVTTQYYQGSDGIRRAKSEFEADANEAAAKKTETEAKVKAAHENVREAFAAYEAAGGAARHTSIEDFLKTPEGLKYKDIHKASFKHINKQVKEEANEWVNKGMGTMSIKDNHFQALITKNNPQSPLTELADGVDHADVAAQVGGILNIITSSNSLDKASDLKSAAQKLEQFVVSAQAAGNNKLTGVDITSLHQLATTSYSNQDELRKAISEFKNKDIYKKILSSVSFDVQEAFK